DYKASPRIRRGRAPTVPIAWRMNSRLSGGIACTAASPRSRASLSGATSLENRRSRPSVTADMLTVSSPRQRP
ncbi:MAG: hypothetical protein ACK56I_31485, partial [bacterium]